MTDLIAKLEAAISETEKIALAAASFCGCCPPTPVWTFADDENGGRIVVEGEHHPAVRKQLSRRWNRSYPDLFTARHIAHNNPDRVLRRLARDRKLLAEYRHAIEYRDELLAAAPGSFEDDGVRDVLTAGACAATEVLESAVRDLAEDYEIEVPGHG